VLAPKGILSLSSLPSAGLSNGVKKQWLCQFFNKLKKIFFGSNDGENGEG